MTTIKLLIYKMIIKLILKVKYNNHPTVGDLYKNADESVKNNYVTGIYKGNNNHPIVLWERKVPNKRI